MSFAKHILMNQTQPLTGYHEVTEDQEFVLGTLWKADDGSVYRYAKAGLNALIVGVVVTAPAQIANHTDVITGAIAAAGQNEVKIATALDTGMSKDDYKDGWLLINDGDGEGHIYRIKSNTADGASGKEPLITLHEPLLVALAAATDVSLVPNPYNGVVVAPHAGLAAHVVGATCRAIPANNYGWLKVHGPAAVLTQGTVILGDEVMVAQTGQNGAVQPKGNDDSQEFVVGHVMAVGATTDYSAIMLKIE